MRTNRSTAISVGVAFTAIIGAALAALATPAAALDPEPVQKPRVSVEYFPQPGGEGRRTEVPVNTDTVSGRPAARSLAPAAGRPTGRWGSCR